MTTPVEQSAVGQPGQSESHEGHGGAHRSRIRIPLWRRITAFFSLAFMTVLGGLVVAGVVGVTILLMLFLLERAIAT